MAKDKLRLDQLLLEQGYFSTREKARRSIMAGLVYVNDQKVDKPGKQVNRESPLTVRTDYNKYVSRGGFKLEKALEQFELDITGRVVVDIGASTGGFTHCLLKNEAWYVHSVDVGYGQLAWKLRNDPRVNVIEKTNIRYADPELFIPRPDIATVDVSFISLELVLPKVLEITVPPHEAIILIKPQFEATRQQIGKKGVVRDKDAHKEILNKVLLNASNSEFTLRDLTYSPITGPKGNVEYLVHLIHDNSSTFVKRDLESTVINVVEEAYEYFEGGSL